MNRSRIQKFIKRCLLVIFSILVIWLLLHVVLRSEQVRPPTYIAHRGGADLAPENTLAAIQRAIELNAPYAEIDIRRTSDDVLVLMHNPTVDATTNGTGLVSDFTWDELRQLDAGSSFSADFAGEPIPRLDTVIEHIMTSNTQLVIEVKDPTLYPGLAEQLLAVIDQFQIADSVYVISFDHTWLSEFQAVAPEIRTGMLWIVPAPWSQFPAETEVVNVHWASILLDPTLVSRLHANGHEVWTWTVNSPLLMNLLNWKGVDGITTDDPEMWLETIGSQGE